MPWDRLEAYSPIARITEEYGRFTDIDQAIEEALTTTGRAILFTGTTLTASVVFWLFFPMKFHGRDGVFAHADPVLARGRRAGIYSVRGVAFQATLRYR